MAINEENLEAEIYAFGSEIIESLKIKAKGGNPFKKAENKLLEWTLKKEEIKINLFRFVDVLPSLQSSKSVVEHVHEYFESIKGEIPLFKFAMMFPPNSWFARFGAKTVSAQIERMSRRFIVGKSGKDALPYLKKLRKKSRTFTLDILGEAVLSEGESKIFVDRYKEIIKTLSAVNDEWKKKYPMAFDHPKDKSIINVSIKPSALYSQAKAIDFDHSVNKLSDKLAELLYEVKKCGGAAYLDMEDCGYTDLTIELVKRVLSSEEFSDYPDFGFVLQAYLKRTEGDILGLIDFLTKRKARTNIRLVKGAYWDSEVMLAKQRGWEVPVFERKSHSDLNYEKLTRLMIDNSNIIYPAFASHNLRSLSHAVQYAKIKNIDPTNFELQFLYGMGDEFKDEFVARGYLVREYSPVGELLPGMSYLVRRLLENTANEGFLRQTNFEELNVEQLLKKPEL